MQDNYINKAGRYRMRAKRPGNGYFGEDGPNATPFIRVPAFCIDDGDQDGKEAVWRGYLTEKAMDRTIEALAKAFPEWDGDLASLENGSFSFEGLECEFVIESETWEGKQRLKVKWLNSIHGGGGKKMDESKIKSLVSKLNGRAKAIAKSARAGEARATAPTSATTEPDEGDDIPF